MRSISTSLFPKIKQLINRYRRPLDSLISPCLVSLLLALQEMIGIKTNIRSALRSGLRTRLKSLSFSTIPAPWMKPEAGRQKRIDLLKEAASQLVETMAAQSTLITHVENPVQFSLVPFAGSVNVGPQYLNAAWMDPEGRSPVNLENFTLPVTIDSTRKIEEKPVGSGRYYKSGTGWGERNNKPYSRAELYADLSCDRKRLGSLGRVVSSLVRAPMRWM